MEKINVQGAAISTHDAINRLLSGLSDTPSSNRSLWIDAKGRVHGHFFNQSVTSKFIPILNKHSHKAIGSEAFVEHEHHAKELHVPSSEPWAYLNEALEDATLTSVDRVLRMVHTLNFFKAPTHQGLLFLTVHSRFLQAVSENHGRAFRRVVESLELSPEQFVIQLPTSANADLALLAFVTDNYRRNGFLTGLQANDFVEAGALIGQIRPDYLSLNLNNTWVEQMFAGLSEAAKRFRVKLIGKTSETPTDSLGGIDYYQLSA
jgi:hypothetical protein